MKLSTPSDFTLTLGSGAYKLGALGATAKFAPPASTRGIAKLYTVSEPAGLIYVGICQSPMSSRLNYGFKANGKSGYYGYKWKGLESCVHLSIWTATDNGQHVSLRELETVEAEVVFLCRARSGKWPSHQHEIHFYQSERRHRDAAEKIYEYAIQGRA